MTARNIFNKAIAIIDEVSEGGTILHEDVAEYEDKALYLLDLWQYEVTSLEDYEIIEITDMAQELQMSDRAAQTGAYYLAEHFALSDMNTEVALYCRRKYQALKTSFTDPLEGASIKDVYGVSRGGLDG